MDKYVNGIFKEKHLLLGITLVLIAIILYFSFFVGDNFCSSCNWKHQGDGVSLDHINSSGIEGYTNVCFKSDPINTSKPFNYCYNVDKSGSPDYQKMMCMAKLTDPERNCNSIVGVEQRPKNVNNPFKPNDLFYSF